MAINTTEGWIPKSALSLFELKSTFAFVIWNLELDLTMTEITEFK